MTPLPRSRRGSFDQVGDAPAEALHQGVGRGGTRRLRARGGCDDADQRLNSTSSAAPRAPPSLAAVFFRRSLSTGLCVADARSHPVGLGDEEAEPSVSASRPGHHLRHRLDPRLDVRQHALGRLERCAGWENVVHDQRAFIDLGKIAAAERRLERDRGGDRYYYGWPARSTSVGGRRESQRALEALVRHPSLVDRRLARGSVEGPPSDREEERRQHQYHREGEYLEDRARDAVEEHERREDGDRAQTLFDERWSNFAQRPLRANVPALEHRTRTCSTTTIASSARASRRRRSHRASSCRATSAEPQADELHRDAARQDNRGGEKPMLTCFSTEIHR